MLRPPIDDKDQKFGENNTGVVLVEFGDYQCPHCGHAYPLLKKLMQEMYQEMTFVFRNFPLNEVHPFATMAALAAEAAGAQGKFWEMHDLIFENQRNLSNDIFLDFSAALQLDEKKFMNSWKSKDALAKVERDFESGVRSGVNGTPTFFINGAILSTYDGSYESLKNAVKNHT
ncbi:MAG: thioredoxin domain-containing protein [Ferruginibacter sp.]